MCIRDSEPGERDRGDVLGGGERDVGDGLGAGGDQSAGGGLGGMRERGDGGPGGGGQQLHLRRELRGGAIGQQRGHWHADEGVRGVPEEVQRRKDVYKRQVVHLRYHSPQTHPLETDN